MWDFCSGESAVETIQVLGSLLFNLFGFIAQGPTLYPSTYILGISLVNLKRYYVSISNNWTKTNTTNIWYMYICVVSMLITNNEESPSSFVSSCSLLLVTKYIVLKIVPLWCLKKVLVPLPWGVTRHHCLVSEVEGASATQLLRRLHLEDQTASAGSWTSTLIFFFCTSVYHF